VTSNETEGVCYPQPKTLEDRLAIARDFSAKYKLELPLLVDGLTNDADDKYAGWPERLYAIDERGVVAFKGDVGPFGYDPDALEAFLKSRY
jgi:hypothetical protein